MPGWTACTVETEPTDLDVYLAHRAALIDYAAPLVGCRARAEDLVQEAFLRYSTRRGKGGERQPIAHPVAYLYRIVRNLAFDWVRRDDAVIDDGAGHIGRLPATSATPEQTTVDRDRLAALAEALTELPERTRIAFDMHRLEGRSLQEVADHLGVSVVRAHQLVKDALRHAAARLDAYDRE